MFVLECKCKNFRFLSGEHGWTVLEHPGGAFADDSGSLPKVRTADSFSLFAAAIASCTLVNLSEPHAGERVHGHDRLLPALVLQLALEDTSRRVCGHSHP